MHKRNLVAFTLALSMAAPLASAEVHESKDGPCKRIVTACEAAGFVKGGHKSKDHPKKGLWKDCFRPIITGQKVEGVTVDAKDIQGCSAKKSEHLHHRQTHED
jgi:hypothetical protein